jgi:hypothetical protein
MIARGSRNHNNFASTQTIRKAHNARSRGKFPRLTALTAGTNSLERIVEIMCQSNDLMLWDGF